MKLTSLKKSILALTFFVLLLAGISMAGSPEELKIAQLENRVQELEQKVNKLSHDSNQFNIRIKELEKKIDRKSSL